MRIQLGLCSLLACVACGPNSSTLPSSFASVALDSPSAGVEALAPRAFFYKLNGSSSGVCAVSVDDGYCRVWQCDDNAYASAPAITMLDPGAFSVSGANRELSFAADDSGVYRAADFDGTALWADGDKLTATFEGSTQVPATSLELSVPPALTVTAPLLPETGLSIALKNDLTVSWEPLGTADQVHVAISSETDAMLPNGDVITNSTPALDCTFTGSSGTGVVRASMLALMPKPSGLKSYHFDVLTFAYSQKRVGDTALELRASWLGMSTVPTIE
ncbi:MAG: hypothetical protein QM756_27570 [Polyangiaceae bacterium]